MSSTHPVSHFDKAMELETEVEHLIQLLSTVVNQLPSANPKDPAISISSCPVLKRSSEAEPTNLAQKTGDEKKKMTVEEVKSRIETFENQIKQKRKQILKKVFPL